MAQPADSRTQSSPPPPTLPPLIKPTNVDKMPDRRQVESRLNQIRDYIRVTTTMMESLSQSSDPRAQTQHDKLSKMIEDLGDSESKLTKLLEDYRGIEETGDRENGGESVESVLRKKMEASQRKLAQLQEHQANLVGMQLQVRERLNEARQAQQALLLQENQTASSPSLVTTSNVWENNSNSSQNQLANDAEVLESETAILRNKLGQLKNKKKQMDNLVAELQAAELQSDRASCSSNNSKNNEHDKAAELEILKSQLSHLKGLMDEATRVRETFNTPYDNLPESNGVNQLSADNGNVNEQDNDIAASLNSLDIDEKFNNTKDRLTVEQIQAVTREMKEQQVILQAARAELQRLKNSALSNNNCAPVASSGHSGSMSPMSSLIGANQIADRKIGNNNNNNINNHNNHNNNNNNINNEVQQQTNKKRQQLEQLVRKDNSHTSSVNRDPGVTGWDSRRASNSRLSHISTPNMWPNNDAPAESSNEHSVDGNMVPDNFLDIGTQPTGVDNGVNWWNLSNPPVNQLPQGTVAPAEYYRQLLMNSQAQQLQLMSTTMQQCCQLIWSQQRELQTMRTSITQLQQQVRQTNNQSRIDVINETSEGYSNLNQSNRHHDNNNLDTTLPPSSSLPNLVSLPNHPSSNHSHTSVIASANSQQNHHHHQQLNNQVPPGNRTNNYWDNFRSYSRQNLLSGNSKSETQPGQSGNTSGTSGSFIRDKRNRENVAENLSLASLSSSDVQYPLNFQLQSNLQSQDRELTTARSNIDNTIDNGTTQQVDNYWEEAHSFRLAPDNNEDLYCLRHLSDEMRDVLQSLVASNRRRPDYLVIILREIKSICDDQRLRPRLLRSLRALQDAQSSRNKSNETIDQTASDSCQSSDDDSDVGALAGSLLNSNPDNQFVTDFLMPGSIRIPGSAISDYEFEGGAMQMDNIIAINSIAPSLAPAYNEDLAEADQSRPEVTNNQQMSLNDGTNDAIDSQDNQVSATLNSSSSSSSSSTSSSNIETNPVLFDAQNSNNNNQIVENSTLDRIPTRLNHH
ncbi:putative uncharacterized protein DDB_G0286901 isoform X2 [Aphidius gifuensis]|nr:putative uncharacterized protein DDB_G0286901 isoform X2 [Aphidius gifuensis]